MFTAAALFRQWRHWRGLHVVHWRADFHCCFTVEFAEWPCLCGPFLTKEEYLSKTTVAHACNLCHWWCWWESQTWMHWTDIRGAGSKDKRTIGLLHGCYVAETSAGNTTCFWQPCSLSNKIAPQRIVHGTRYWATVSKHSWFYCSGHVDTQLTGSQPGRLCHLVHRAAACVSDQSFFVFAR